MPDYKPELPFTEPADLLIPKIKKVKGVLIKEYPDTGDCIFISFRSFGGTESERNGQLTVENTGVVQTWYRDDIKADCRLTIRGVSYDILGTPENINMRNRYLQFKVRAVKGGA